MLKTIFSQIYAIMFLPHTMQATLSYPMAGSCSISALPPGVLGANALPVTNVSFDAASRRLHVRYGDGCALMWTWKDGDNPAVVRA